MPALNFKKQFAASIVTGKKLHTIRAKRKQPIHVGDSLFLFTGMRTKDCRRLGATVCSKVERIFISKRRQVKINGVKLSLQEVNLLAIADGFTHFKPLGDFFEQVHGLPFHGQIIHWKKLKP